MGLQRVVAVISGQWTDPPKRAADLRLCAILQVNRVERVKGIEPSLSAWEADVLPLNYTREAAPEDGIRRSG